VIRRPFEVFHWSNAENCGVDGLMKTSSEESKSRGQHQCEISEAIIISFDLVN